MQKGLENFLEGIPESNDPEVKEKAPFAPIKQSWARFKTLERGNGQLRGCFSDSFSGACIEQRITSIQLGAILYEQDGGDCADGFQVWIVTHN